MTTVTIAAAVRGSAHAAILIITVTGAAAGETMTVSRRVGTTPAQIVMGTEAIEAQSRVLIDPETPLNRAATWTVTTSTGASATSAQLTVPVELATLADPIRSLTAECAVIDRDDWRRAQRVELITVEGSSHPAVVWDVPLAKTMPITLLTFTPAAEAVMDRLMATNDPLLLRCVCGHHADVWIQSISDAAGSSRLIKRGSADTRSWDLGSCLIYSANPRAGLAAKAAGLGDVHDAVEPKVLGAIADRWGTLGAIAEADLGA